MKNKKGFTLIELLAVIVILAIIMVIAVPQILNVINKSNESAANSSIKLVKDAIKTQVTTSSMSNANFEKTGECYLFDFENSNTNTLNLSLKNKDKIGGSIKYCNGKFEEDELYFDNYKDNDNIPKPVSFSSDSWATIAKAVKNGNISKYSVGDTKKIDMGEFGEHMLRIANISTPNECEIDGFSQTTCGFVIEFSDIIEKHALNTENTNVGGWPASELYEYVNNTIYNSLPYELKSIIINTKVVSSHGQSDSNNFISIDKLYLLSTKEVFGKGSVSNVVTVDTAENETRQLDYYEEKGVTTSNYSFAIKKYNDVANSWALRSAPSDFTERFFYVNSSGDWVREDANDYKGISPAFRIGN